MTKKQHEELVKLKEETKMQIIERIKDLKKLGNFKNKDLKKTNDLFQNTFESFEFNNIYHLSNHEFFKLSNEEIEILFDFFDSNQETPKGIAFLMN